MSGKFQLSEQQAAMQKGYDEFAPTYEQFGGGTPFIQNFRVSHLIAHSLGYRAIRPRSMLDLGAGTGMTIESVRELLHIDPSLKRVTAVDLSGEMLQKNLGKAMPAKLIVVQDSIEHYLDNARQKFDLITSVGAFDFMPNLPNVLAQAGKLLNPGGILAATYLPRSADQPASITSHSEGLDIDFTEYFYTPSEVESGFSQPGLEVVGRHVVEAAYRRDEKEITYNLVVAQS